MGEAASAFETANAARPAKRHGLFWLGFQALDQATENTRTTTSFTCSQAQQLVEAMCEMAEY